MPTLYKYRVCAKDNSDPVFILATHFYIEGDIVIFEHCLKQGDINRTKSVACFHAPNSVMQIPADG